MDDSKNTILLSDDAVNTIEALQRGYKATARVLGRLGIPLPTGDKITPQFVTETALTLMWECLDPTARKIAGLLGSGSDEIATLVVAAIEHTKDTLGETPADKSDDEPEPEDAALGDDEIILTEGAQTALMCMGEALADQQPTLNDQLNDSLIVNFAVHTTHALMHGWHEEAGNDVLKVMNKALVLALEEAEE